MTFIDTLRKRNFFNAKDKILSALTWRLHCFRKQLPGSVVAFQEKFNVLNDPGEVIIDFKESRVVGDSAIDALNKVTERYSKVAKKVHLGHLSEDCKLLLEYASEIIIVNYREDPQYKVIVNRIEG